MRLWNKAADKPWAITSSALTTILDIATQQNISPEAAAIKLEPKLKNNYCLEIRNGIAILQIVGPLFRYSNLFTQISTASSYELLAKNFTQAIENPDIHAIILNIDSPGGEVNGCSEFADMIYEARKIKPIIAYASGDAASGAYWIAAAAKEIVISKTSALGSIGVVGVYRNSKDRQTIEIVSSQSPYKRLMPDTDKGQVRLQKRIDAMANVFIEAVAKYRRIDPNHVQNHYGSGDVFIGESAVYQGLADRIGSFEKLIDELNNNLRLDPAQHSINSHQKEKNMDNIQSLRDTYPNLMTTFEQEANKQGIATERTRVRNILSHDEANYRTLLAQHLAFETNIEVEAAISILSKAPIENPSREDVSGFSAAMAAIPNPEITPSLEIESDNEEAVAKRLATY